MVVFPNPSNSNISINAVNELGNVSIYNAVGQLIMQQETTQNNLKIDLSNQIAGIYFLKVGNNYTKIVKH